MSSGVDDGWILARAVDADTKALMTWFKDAHSVNVWGGPTFRFPFDRESFTEDCRLRELTTFALRDPDDRFCAFGQMYERDRRINLARLIAHPQMRGQGIGNRLVQMLIGVGPSLFALNEFSLYVYRDNAPALRCYRSQGFEIQDYPADQPLADDCFYLTRPVERRGCRLPGGASPATGMTP